MKKEKPGHQFPHNLLEQINEHTAGFILFTIDANHNPCVYNKFDCQVDEMGLSNFVRHYADTIETAHSNGVYASILGNPNGDDED